jgi:hypothetical protein
LSRWRTPAQNATRRNVFGTGPDKQFMLGLAYPMTWANFDELLSVTDWLQLTASHQLTTAAQWQPVILADFVTDETVRERYPDDWEQPPAVHARRPCALTNPNLDPSSTRGPRSAPARSPSTGRRDWDDSAVAWMVGGALGARTQSKSAQSPADGSVRASEQLGEAGGVERVVQAQQLVLLAGPPPSMAGRWRRLGRVDPEPGCVATDRLRGPTEPLSDVLQCAPAGAQLHQALVVVNAPAPRVADQIELPGSCRQARRAAVG